MTGADLLRLVLLIEAVREIDAALTAAARASHWPTMRLARLYALRGFPRAPRARKFITSPPPPPERSHWTPQPASAGTAVGRTGVSAMAPV